MGADPSLPGNINGRGFILNISDIETKVVPESVSKLGKCLYHYVCTELGHKHMSY